MHFAAMYRHLCLSLLPLCPQGLRGRPGISAMVSKWIVSAQGTVLDPNATPLSEKVFMKPRLWPSSGYQFGFVTCCALPHVTGCLILCLRCRACAQCILHLALVMQTDLVAGISVGAMVVPQGMSYAKLAGLPNVYGLYGAFVPVMIYAALGSSPQLVCIFRIITPSASSLAWCCTSCSCTSGHSFVSIDYDCNIVMF